MLAPTHTQSCPLPALRAACTSSASGHCSCWTPAQGPISSPCLEAQNAQLGVLLPNRLVNFIQMLPPAQKAPTINTLSHGLLCQPQECLVSRRRVVTPLLLQRRPECAQTPRLCTHKQMLTHKFNVVLLRLQHLHSTGSRAKKRWREEPLALSREWTVCGARTAHQHAPGRQLPAGQDSRRGRKKHRRNQYLGRFTSTLEERERGRRVVRDAGQAAPHPLH